MEDVRLGGSFAKLDEDKHLAFGWAYVSEDAGEVVTDHSGEFIDKAALPALEDAAYDYMLESRQADEMHVRVSGIGEIIESVMLTPEKMKAMGITGDKVGWWVGMKIFDDGVWAKVKDGTYSAFSIRGTGDLEDIADA